MIPPPQVLEAETAMRQAYSVVFAAALMVLGGCATASTLTGKNEQKVYGGTRLDATLISEGFSSDSPAAKTAGIERPILACEGLCGLVDLPLSVVADTVVLPVTVPISLNHSQPDAQRDRPSGSQAETP
jgi:uncharacterized protein YceK